MQKKSFLIKDILQKLNEDPANKPETNPAQQKKPMQSIDSSRLLYDWHSLAMAAVSQQQLQQQNNALINAKAVFNWSKFSLPIIPDGYLLSEQSKLAGYLPFADTLQQSAAAVLENYQKQRQLNLIDDRLVDISESSNLSLGESSPSSKFSDCESNDARSEVSSLISIENTTEDEANLKSAKKSEQKARGEAKKRRKNRRNRTVFTELQLMGLERRFDSQKYLSTPDRAELANALGLSQLQVKTWYQNRRMKWKKQVMQGGCPIAPTKPKGRPKKGEIPSLGLTFQMNSLLSTIEARKNAALLDKETGSKPGTGPYGDSKSDPDAGSSVGLSVGSSVGPSLCNVSQLMAQHSELGQPFFSKADAFGTKRAKLSF